MKLSIINKSNSDQGFGFCCGCTIKLDGIIQKMCVEADDHIKLNYRQFAAAGVSEDNA